MKPLVPTLLKPLASLLSGSGHNARLSILIYHRVAATTDPMLPTDMDAARFRWQMELIAEHFHPISLPEALQRLKTNSLPARAVAVTFDDGYSNNYTVALPILKEFDLPATVFVASGFLNGGRMWNDTLIETARHLPKGDNDLKEFDLGERRIETTQDRIALAEAMIRRFRYLPMEQREREITHIAERASGALPTDLMLTDEQIRGLRDGGVEIGGHTVNHPILAKIDGAQARQEIQTGKEQLEAVIEQALKVFAYPNGQPDVDYTGEHVKMVKGLGFTGAVSTRRGVSSRQSDPFQLPRFTPWGTIQSKFMGRMIWNYQRPGNVKADSIESAFGASC